MPQTSLQASANRSWLPEIERTLQEQRVFLIRLAHAQLRDTQWAEDVVQDTSLAAWQSAARFEGRSTIRTWLVGILRFKIFDALKDRQRFPTPMSAMAVDEEFSSLEDDLLFDAQGRWSEMPQVWWTDEDGPAEALQQRQTLNQLELCLQKLPESTAQIFLLREYLGFEGPDIAQRTGLTHGHVRVILMRARLALRTCLDWRLSAAP
jgi:RNA polymerase sigma-70 factor (ECF subfamily)